MAINSAPSATRAKSYSGGYMEFGKMGEEIVLNWLRKNSKILGVDDLRELRVMREADADCMITNREGADARETHSEGGSFASEDIPAIIRVNPILNWNLLCARLG